jgi:Tol biopolymer transport system component
MSDHRQVLERGLHEFRAPELPYEAILQRRDRHRRNKRVAAVVVGLGIGIAAILVGTSVLRTHRTTPANPEPPLKHNGAIAIVDETSPSEAGSVFLIDPTTGSRSRLTVCPECEPIDSLEDLRWSPDGGKISYTTCRRGCAYGHVGVFDLATTTTSRIATCKRSAEGSAVCDGRLERSPDGSRIALGGYEGLVLVDPDGSNRMTLADFGDDRGWVGRPAWSPDGRTIAFSVQFFGATQAMSRLYLVDADGSNLRIILERPGHVGMRDPKWSPDGSRLAYMATVPLKPAGGIPQVWIVDADGSDPSKLFVAGACCVGYGTGLTWAPDGTEIAFVGRPPRGRNGTPRVYLIDPDGGNVRVLARDVPFGQPAWQPIP